jgi:hypothetical protein
MPIKTNLNSAPYFDDFDQEDNYYKVLFRPSTAVQARELTGLQSMLQDQISKFGRHIFIEGSVIEGCSFAFDANYTYAKLNDNLSDGTVYDVASLQGYYAEDGDGLRAQILNTVDGLESATPDLKTIYFRYLTGVTVNNVTKSSFVPGDTLYIKDSSGNTIYTVGINADSQSVGKGYAFTCSAGVVYKNGFFIRVPAQTCIVVKYGNYPDNLSAGFAIIESIASSETDTSLLDNAAGAPNFAAPGAHRLKLVPNLVVKEMSVQDSDDFFSLVDFRGGVPISIRTSPQYNALGKEMAKRTFEESGNYVVKPYLLKPVELPLTTAGVANSTHFGISVSPGVAYVEGFRTEHVGYDLIPVRKATDTKQNLSQQISLNFGSYLRINDYAGQFDPTQFNRIELHNQEYNALTNGSFTDVAYLSTQKIGLASVGGLAYDSGTPGTPDAVYNLYLFRINMLAGKAFENVKSVVYYYNNNVVGVADVVLDNGIAVLKGPGVTDAIYNFGQSGLAHNASENYEYVYRTKISTSFNESGIATAQIPSSYLTGDQQFEVTGTLSNTLEKDLIVVTTNSVDCTAGLSTVTVASGNNKITAASSDAHFDTKFKAGDYVKVGSIVKMVQTVANSTVMYASSNYAAPQSGATYWKTFPAGYVIPIATRDDRTITVSPNTTATIDLNEDLQSALSVNVYTCGRRYNTVPMRKNVRKNRYVRINCATHPNGTQGPWDLGLTDVINITSVYIDKAGAYDITGQDYRGSFTFNSGQRDAYYDHAKLQKRSTSLPPLTADSTIVVKLDYLETDMTQGVGFYTIDSYPINDTTTSDTTITTMEIPSYTSQSSNITYALRDCVDFRPQIINTAVDSIVVSDATINPISSAQYNISSKGSYFPCPDSSFQLDPVHYERRIDRIVMTTQGKLMVIEGIPSEDPIPPAEKPGMMSLGTVTIPPFPSLVYTQMRNIPQTRQNSQFVTVDLTQQRRYTMKDIGKIDNRVTVLEYYTALNLLEKKAADMLVRDDQGNNRYKNGFLADPFDNHFIGNTGRREYNCSIDPVKTEMRPKFRQLQLLPHVLRNEETGQLIGLTNAVRRGRPAAGKVTLSYTEVPYIIQEYASKKRNCVEGNVRTYQGRIILTPNIDTEPDLHMNPDIVNNFDNNTEHQNMSNSLTTNYGNWHYYDNSGGGDGGGGGGDGGGGGNN